MFRIWVTIVMHDEKSGGAPILDKVGLLMCGTHGGARLLMTTAVTILTRTRCALHRTLQASVTADAVRNATREGRC